MSATMLSEQFKGSPLEEWFDSLADAVQQALDVLAGLATSASESATIMEAFEAMMRATRAATKPADTAWHAVECRHNALAEIRIKAAVVITKSAGYYRRMLLPKSGFIGSAGKRMKGK